MALVILDRDGVINQDSPLYIKSAREWLPLPGSIEAIALISQKGYAVYIATNQAGIGRGIFDLPALEAIHVKLHKLVNAAGGRIAGIHFCPHHPEDHCRCRKPNTGLLEQISALSGEDLRRQPLVGDSLKDIEAGLQMGCKPMLVLTGQGKITYEHIDPTNVDVYPDLLAFAKALPPVLDY